MLYARNNNVANREIENVAHGKWMVKKPLAHMSNDVAAPMAELMTWHMMW